MNKLYILLLDWGKINHIYYQSFHLLFLLALLLPSSGPTALPFRAFIGKKQITEISIIIPFADWTCIQGYSVDSYLPKITNFLHGHYLEVNVHLLIWKLRHKFLCIFNLGHWIYQFKYFDIKELYNSFSFFCILSV